jgi:hypothetical protein
MWRGAWTWKKIHLFKKRTKKLEKKQTLMRRTTRKKKVKNKTLAQTKP